MGRIIGIDLGTTKSCAAVFNNGKPVIIKNAEGEMTTPSVVAFLKTGAMLVGEPARRQAVTNEERTFFSFKRDIGKDNNYMIDRNEYSPWQIYAIVLKKLKVDAESYLGERVTEAVITVPAYFGCLQRQEVMDAAKLAGLDVKHIISDSAATGLTYGIRRGTSDDFEENIMIYDLGGGNFNVVIFDIGYGVVNVRAVGGAPHLGGDDFDNRIVRWMLEEFKKEEGEDISNDKAAVRRLKEAAEKAKKELSYVTATDIHIPFFAFTAAGVKHFDRVLTRAKFEELTCDLVEKTVNVAQIAMKDAGLDYSDLKQVFLTGGSTRIPAVQEKVRQFTGKEPSKLLSRDECVAIGASILCGMLEGDAMAGGILLIDVVSRSLSIETKGGEAARLIVRNTTIPTKKSKIFSIAEDNQTAVDIKIVEGESRFAKDNRLLGQFRLDGIMPAKKGEAQIEVTFDIDAHGRVEASAKNLDTGKELKKTLPISKPF